MAAGALILSFVAAIGLVLIFIAFSSGGEEREWFCFECQRKYNIEFTRSQVEASHSQTGCRGKIRYCEGLDDPPSSRS